MGSDTVLLFQETAALRVPYKGTSNKGLLLHSDEDLAQHIGNANAAGYRVEVHAIGTSVDSNMSMYELLD